VTVPCGAVYSKISFDRRSSPHREQFDGLEIRMNVVRPHRRDKWGSFALPSFHRPPKSLRRNTAGERRRLDAPAVFRTDDFAHVALVPRMTGLPSLSVFVRVTFTVAPLGVR
jgi:hypothetical protein